MNTKSICIIGTGGFAREVVCLLDDLGLFGRIAGLFEPDALWSEKWRGVRLMDLEVLPYSQIEPGKHTAAIGIGNPVNRRNAQSELPGTLEYGTFIHPDARVSRWADIGTGGIITAGCIVTSQIRIGQQCHLNLNTTIGHDCQIGDYVTTAPAVNISGICTIGNNVYFGTGSSTRQGLMIVDDTVIGMGAMVVKDIDEPGTYIGIPAKKLES